MLTVGEVEIQQSTATDEFLSVTNAISADRNLS